MAYVLSLMPHSPLGTPYDQKSYERSWSSLGSTGTVHHRRSRQLSVGSLASAASIYATPWRSSSNQGSPLRSTSYSDLDSGANPTALNRLPSANNITRPFSVPPAVPQLHCTSSPLASPVPSETHLGTPQSRNDHSALDLVDEEKTGWEEDHALLESETFDTSPPDLQLPVAIDSAEIRSPASRQPFERWVNTLRLKKASYKNRTRPKLDGLLSPLPTPSSATTSPDRSCKGHRKSESWTSSVNFVTAVKSATITIASASIAPLSRSGSKRSGRARLIRVSSGLFDPEPRFSTDTGRPSLSLIVDDGARQRARKRREKIEELIRTEESYLSDLKALSNVGNY